MRSFRTTLIVFFFIALTIIIVDAKGDITSYLTRFKLAFRAAGDSAYSYESFKELQSAYDSIKASEMGAGGNEYDALTAHVYSSYPYNDRNIITIDRGDEDGIKEGMPVVIGKRYLIGKVIKVHRRQSDVQTIFDPLWRSTVSVGASSAYSLLEGAYPPRLELIPKEKDIYEGEPVISVSRDFPYGLYVGTVAKISSSTRTVWQNGVLDTKIYDDVKEVGVLTNFP